MKLVFLGTGVAIPDGRAQSGIYIETDLNILVDCGHGVFLRMAQKGISPEDIDLIAVTHSHTDHMGDLIAILKARWLKGADDLKIMAPPEARKTLSAIINAYGYLKEKLRFVFVDCPAVVGKNEIECAPASHSVETWGYRIDHGGKGVTISGDTHPASEIFELAEGGVLVHELSFPSGVDIRNHTTPEKLIPFLQKYEFSKVILTHMYPEALERIDEIRGEFRRYNTLFAQDMMELEV